MEWFIIGVIGGYFLPMWCAEAANPNSRTPITTAMNTEFSNLDFSNTLTDVLLTSYNYEQQDAQFYGNWFNQNENYGTDHTTSTYVKPTAPAYNTTMASVAADPTVF
jgi:hypothetical protein